MFRRIVTHNDFDGLFSAALCAAIHDVDDIAFTGPNQVSRRGFSVTAEDIVCDLPYPGECGLWFDHHEGNIKELNMRGVDAAGIRGRFALEKSCARVIYNFYRDEYAFPPFYEETVRAVDEIDSFDFPSIAEWRRERPAKTVNESLKAPFRDTADQENYFRGVIGRLAEKPLAALAEDHDVLGRYAQYLEVESRMIETIQKTVRFHPLDAAREFAVIDLTGFSKKIQMERNLSQILFPQIKAVFLVQSLFDLGVKTNNFMISGSLTIKNGSSEKDIGEIMRSLNIGDGHRGAGSGQVHCGSKAEMEKSRETYLDRIYELWAAQVA